MPICLVLASTTKRQVRLFNCVLWSALNIYISGLKKCCHGINASLMKWRGSKSSRTSHASSVIRAFWILERCIFCSGSYEQSIVFTSILYLNIQARCLRLHQNHGKSHSLELEPSVIYHLRTKKSRYEWYWNFHQKGLLLFEIERQHNRLGRFWTSHWLVNRNKLTMQDLWFALHPTNFMSMTLKYF